MTGMTVPYYTPVPTIAMIGWLIQIYQKQQRQTSKVSTDIRSSSSFGYRGGTRMLLLFNVDDDQNLFGGLAARIDNQQQLERASIAGKLYYRLKCTVIEFNKSDIINGVINRTYSKFKFKEDFKTRKVSF